MTAQNPEDELERLMRDNAQKAQRISGQASGLYSWAQQMMDLSNAGQQVAKYPIPSNVDWEAMIGSYQRANEQADAVLHALGAIQYGPVSSSASGLNLAMTQLISPSGLFASLPAQKQADAIRAQSNLSDVIDQSFKTKNVIDLMRQFGLDNEQPGKKSAIEQFEIAWAAFEKPVTQSSPINTSLIPMRESIETAIAELLRRRSSQEPAKSQQSKIISIGNQAARDGISASDIQTWALEWDKLANELSGTKQGNFSRDEWRNLLRQATLFLQGLLQGLNPEKLR